MVRLIINELIKIKKKKSFLIITLIFILYVILTNIIYKNLNDLPETKPLNIQELEQKNEELKINKNEHITEYLSNLGRMETEKLKLKYQSNNLNYLIDNYLYDVTYNLKLAYYRDDTESILELQKQYDLIYNKIKIMIINTF